MGTIHKQTAGGEAATWTYPSVPLTEYRADASPGITKHILIGRAEGATDFVIRYFTIPPGEKSALDKHPHQHGVVVIQGCGRVLLGEQWHDIQVGDSIFTGTDELHQFEAVGAEPLGFICVIPVWAEADSCAIPIDA
jgi:quercetin dioxygenase-like cupin family protein